MTYERLAGSTGQSYSTASIQAALLSDGRGSQPGLKLLKRVSGKDRRQKMLVVSRTGLAVARIFATAVDGNVTSAPPAGDDLSRPLETAVLPTLRLALQEAPHINLGTFCVLLYIAQNSEAFGHRGKRSSVIADELKLSNLPRNIAVLAEGSEDRPGLGLVSVRKAESDRRVSLPDLTIKGLTLVANIAAALQDKDPDPVRRPKPDRLHEASSADAVGQFTDEDYDVIPIEKMERPWDETS